MEKTIPLPPASGLTTTAFLKSGICSEIHRMTAGSAKRLSTGISKNPLKDEMQCVRSIGSLLEFVRRANPWWWCDRHRQRSAYSPPISLKSARDSCPCGLVERRENMEWRQWRGMRRRFYTHWSWLKVPSDYRWFRHSRSERWKHLRHEQIREFRHSFLCCWISWWWRGPVRDPVEHRLISSIPDETNLQKLWCSAFVVITMDDVRPVFELLNVETKLDSNRNPFGLLNTNHHQGETDGHL